MNFLILGSGGREHSLGWKLAQIPYQNIQNIYYAPGNAGTLSENKSSGNFSDYNNFYEIKRLIEEKQIDYIIPGNENLLYDGITNYLNSEGFNNVFGPTKEASIIEWDKFYSNELMISLDISCAYSIPCVNREEILRAINDIYNKNNNGYVLKARGLTKGKGVSVFDSLDNISKNVDNFICKYGEQILVSEKLIGEEFSVFAVSDGENVIPFPYIIKDYKKLLNRDLGPNTGGMGSHRSYIKKEILLKHGNENIDISSYVCDTIIKPIIKQFKEYRRNYIGFIYAGMMKLQNGVLKVLEFNSRLGDPECQCLMMLLKTDLSDIIIGSLNKNIPKIECKEGHSICVVITLKGYPDNYNINIPIDLNFEIKDENIKIFHAGTIFDKDNNIVTNGGRVLNIVAYDKYSLSNARQKAYKIVKKIDNLNPEIFYYRKDIGGYYDENGYFKVCGE